MFQTNLASIKSYCVVFISEGEASATELEEEILLHKKESEGTYLKLTDIISFNLEKCCITTVTYQHFWVHQYISQQSTVLAQTVSRCVI